MLVPVTLITVMHIHCHVNCQVFIRYGNCASMNIGVLQEASRETAGIVDMENLYFHMTTTGNIVKLKKNYEKAQNKEMCPE